MFDFLSGLDSDERTLFLLENKEYLDWIVRDTLQQVCEAAIIYCLFFLVIGVLQAIL
jgi:hypothetical protein